MDLDLSQSWYSPRMAIYSRRTPAAWNARNVYQGAFGLQIQNTNIPTHFSSPPNHLILQHPPDFVDLSDTSQISFPLAVCEAALAPATFARESQNTWSVVPAPNNMSSDPPPPILDDTSNKIVPPTTPGSSSAQNQPNKNSNTDTQSPSNDKSNTATMAESSGVGLKRPSASESPSASEQPSAVTKRQKTVVRKSLESHGGSGDDEDEKRGLEGTGKEEGSEEEDSEDDDEKKAKRAAKGKGREVVEDAVSDSDADADGEFSSYKLLFSLHLD